MATQVSGAAGALDLPQDSAADLEHEFDLVRSAIALLAAGGASRITLVGLPLDSRALSEVGSLVRSSGMAMRAVRGTVGCDITVEAGG
ncbi:MAG TPA: hypothetical protein VFJ00_01835 [Candidatus Limnocylindria bacterium]|nr:hypothetical protein [Candidatus Limnocylindria bacterium]